MSLSPTVAGREPAALNRSADLLAATAAGTEAQLAVWVVADLALRPGETVAAAELAVRYQIPRPDLLHIVAVLAAAGIVRTAKGINAGCAFCGNPRRLSLYDVMSLFPDRSDAAPAGGRTAVGREVGRRLTEIRRIAEAAMRSVTFAALLDQIARDPPAIAEVRPSGPPRAGIG